MKVIWSTILLIVCSQLFATNYTYKEKTQNNITESTITFNTIEEGFKLETKTENGIWVSYADNNLQVYKTIINNPAEKINLVIERTNKTVTIKGSFDEKAINKKIKVDKAPLKGGYFLLKDFALNNKKETDFLIVVIANQEIMKLKAIKEQQEIVKISGEPVQCQKVRITLPDWRSFMWSSYAWYRLKDGLMVKTEELRGPPGTPLTKTELVNETQ